MIAFADIDQLNARSGCEVGVQAKRLDSEGNKIGDFLAGAVTAVEQLKIFYRVVLAAAVSMMNGFGLKKIAAKMLGHDVAVFEDLTLSAAYPARDRNPHVAVSLHMPSVLTGIKPHNRLVDLILSFAFYAAEFLLGIYAATRFTASVVLFSTLGANKSRSRGGISHPPEVGTWARAIHRVFAEFLSILSNVTRLHAERFAALLAAKGRFIDWLRSSAMFELISRLTRTFAETSACGARRNTKNGAAIFTNFFNRHLISPVCGDAVSLIGVYK